MDKAEIIKLAAEAALKHFEKLQQQDIKSRHDKRLRNTKLLLKNYQMLKDHCQLSVSNLQQLSNTENAIDVLDSIELLDSSTYVNAIKRSTTRTFIILKHIEDMLVLYQIYCNRSGKDEDQRRYRVMHKHYVEQRKIEDIAAGENIDRRTCYRDIDDACEKLSALIFGIDGLTQMSQTCHLRDNPTRNII